MTPLIFRVLASGGWILFAFLCWALWPDLLRTGYFLLPSEPLDAAVLMILVAALLGVILTSLLADWVVVAPPIPLENPSASPKFPVENASTMKSSIGSRSSQRLAAVQARFDTPLPSDMAPKTRIVEDPLADPTADQQKVRALEKEGKFQQALALASQMGDHISTARLYMKMGQYLHALDVYVEMEDFEGAAMAATLKGDIAMGKAFWRQAALNTQNAGAANPNILGGLWDRAGNPAAAAASYEAGGMFKKAMECYMAAGDKSSAERCRQKKSLQPETELPDQITSEEAIESARYLAQKGDLFGAAEALMEGKLFAEAAAHYERIEDFSRALMAYEAAGREDKLPALREKNAKAKAKAESSKKLKAATGPEEPLPNPAAPTPAKPRESNTDSSVDSASKSSSNPGRLRPGIIAMEAAGIEVPSDINPLTSSNFILEQAVAQADKSVDLDDTQERGNRPPPEKIDLTATTVRPKARPAGTVRPLDMAVVDLSATQHDTSGQAAKKSAEKSKPNFDPSARQNYVPFAGELPTPTNFFTTPPPLPWKAGWPLKTPLPRAIGTPLFVPAIAGEQILVYKPALAIAAEQRLLQENLLPNDTNEIETIQLNPKDTSVVGFDPQKIYDLVQTYAEQGKIEDAALLAGAIDAWGATATLLDTAGRWSESADLWRRLGQWNESIHALLQDNRFADAALLAFASGRVARAVAILRRAIRQFPERTEKLAHLIGRMLVIAGRTDLALKLLRNIMAPTGPGPQTAIAVFRMGRMLEDHDALEEAHAIYLALLEVGARSDELRDREIHLARELGLPRFSPDNQTPLAGAKGFTTEDRSLATQIDSISDANTLYDGPPVTLVDLNPNQTVAWLLSHQPAAHRKGQPTIPLKAEPFPLNLPEDLVGRPMAARDATASRVVSSNLSLSLFGTPLAPPEPFNQVWRFVIRDIRASRGRETLYVAEDSLLKQMVALRVFGRGSVYARGVAWFADRVRPLAALHHPNILPILDMGIADLRPYIIEPFVPGGNLAERMKQGGPIPFASALRIILQIARALDAAAQVGITHNHIHPAQVLFLENGEVALSGWGVDILRSGPQCRVGHPDGNCSQRVDLRSLGLIAYGMISGQLPAERNPLPLHGIRPEVPEPFGQIVDYCIGSDPKYRYHSTGEFLPALEQLCTAV